MVKEWGLVVNWIFMLVWNHHIYLASITNFQEQEYNEIQSNTVNHERMQNLITFSLIVQRHSGPQSVGQSWGLFIPLTSSDLSFQKGIRLKLTDSGKWPRSFIFDIGLLNFFFFFCLLFCLKKKKIRVQGIYIFFFSGSRNTPSNSADCLSMQLTASAQVGPLFRKPVQFRKIKQDLAVLLCLLSNEVWERPTILEYTKLTGCLPSE